MTFDIPPEKLSERDTLVLSDAFPPFAEGGAELSLKACLSELSSTEKKRIVVLSFSRHVKTIETTEDDNILAIHVPENAPWPYSHLFITEFEQIVTNHPLGERNYGRITRLKRQFLSHNRRAAADAYREARLRPSGGILTDHFIDGSDVRIKFLNKIIPKMKSVSLMLCDNTRSILLGSLIRDNLPEETKTVAVVRDNRFHCARPAQNRSVKGKLCTKCNFACAAEDTKDQKPHLRQKTLGHSQTFRQTALRRYDTVIVTSHELMRHIAPILDPKQQIERIPNSLGSITETEKFSVGIAQEIRVNLVIIGMLNENKGQLEFIRKTTHWLKDRPNYRIILCGRGDRIKGAIESHIKNEGLKQQVQLLGYRSRKEVFQQIRKSHLVVAPTIWPEPFGRVPLEAGLSGRAIVAFAVGGLNETIVHGKTGVLVRQNDYSAMTEAIDQLIDNPKERWDMEQAARDWLVRRYSPDRTTKKFATLVFGPQASQLSEQGARATDQTLGALSDDGSIGLNSELKEA